MNTTYDEIYQFFINNISVDQLSLPNTIEGQYELIRNGIAHYNGITRGSIVCDNTTETVNKILNNDDFLAIAHILKRILINNLLMYKSSVLIGFTKELGVKNVGDQLKALRDQIKDEDDEIDMILFRADDSTIMD